MAMFRRFANHQKESWQPITLATQFFEVQSTRRFRSPQKTLPIAQTKSVKPASANNSCARNKTTIRESGNPSRLRMNASRPPKAMRADPTSNRIAAERNCALSIVQSFTSNVAKLLGALPDRNTGVALPEEKRRNRRKKKRGNSPQFDLRQLLYLMSGVDLTRVDGIDVITAMTVVAEAGYDMSPWPTVDHFVSWLRLAPDNRISGDKIIGKGKTPTQNRLTQALKMAASTLKTSKTYLGAQFRRLRARRGPAIAIKAMAAKLARLVYNMLRHGMEYVDRGIEFYEQQQRERRICALAKNAAELGFQLKPAAS